MPEGDTIHKLAAAIAPRLTGRVLAEGRIRAIPEVRLAGRTVEAVFARGKHLFVELEGDLVVRSHLGMNGSWHRYPTGKPWKKPEHRAALVLSTSEEVFVCFDAKEVECARRTSVRHADAVRRLGPDLIADEVDLGEVVRRARDLADPEDRAMELLLDQRVACGIGNVYKSEVLFLERVHPFTRVADLDDAAIGRMYARASVLLRANLRPGMRATRKDEGAGELWVYGRLGKPCHECGTAIRYARTGRGNRSTYWCPRCQA